MYLNKVMLYGNLTRDPELKSLPSGNKVCTFGLATNRVYKDKAGAKQEQTEFHNVVLWQRLAELASQYLKKGNGVYVEGRLTTRSWEDANGGGKKYRTEIVADQMQFGPKSNSFAGNSPAQSSGSTESKNPADELETIDYGDGADVNPDDIPF